MATMTAVQQSVSGQKIRPPSGLHHNNFYSNDLEACRHFYEDIIGIPLIAFWIEPFPETPEAPAHVLGHAMFGLGDGSMMAFMHFPNEELQKRIVGTEQPASVHFALNVDEEQLAGIRERLHAAGLASKIFIDMDSPLARSLYVRDPDGLVVEFACDKPGARETYYDPNAHEVLKRYLAGDHTPTEAYKTFHD